MELELLVRAGQSLYGERWQSELAAALPVNLRTLQRWVAGQNNVADWVKPRILELLQERQKEIASLARELVA